MLWSVFSFSAFVLFVKSVRGLFVDVRMLFWSSLNVCAPAVPWSDKIASPAAGSTVILEPVVEMLPLKVALPVSEIVKLVV